MESKFLFAHFIFKNTYETQINVAWYICFLSFVCLFVCFLHMFQEALDKKLASWQSENERLTRDSCTSLLKQLKKEHLDPVLAQLHGEGGAKVMFEDIVAGYNRVEHDYKARATGAKDVCAAVFFEFHPVNECFPSITK